MSSDKIDEERQREIAAEYWQLLGTKTELEAEHYLKVEYSLSAADILELAEKFPRK